MDVVICEWRVSDNKLLNPDATTSIFYLTNYINVLVHNCRGNRDSWMVR